MHQGLRPGDPAAAQEEDALLVYAKRDSPCTPCSVACPGFYIIIPDDVIKHITRSAANPQPDRCIRRSTRPQLIFKGTQSLIRKINGSVHDKTLMPKTQIV